MHTANKPKAPEHKPTASPPAPAKPVVVHPNAEAERRDREPVKADHDKKAKDIEAKRVAAEKASDEVKTEEVALKASESSPPHSPTHAKDVVAPPAKVLSDLQVLANKFRAVADDQKKVQALVEAGLINVPAINPGNPSTYSLTESEALCQRFKMATDGNEVRRICDEIDARKK